MIKSVYIIAEAGVNHNGEISKAKKLVDIAAASGANAVKFQLFKADKLVSKTAAKAEYQISNTGNDDSQYEMLKKLELNAEEQNEIFLYCQAQEIDFLSSPFDIDSVHELSNMGLRTFKIPSGEITNVPYLRAIGELNQNTILSTGMSDMQEVADAIKILEEAGQDIEKVTVLHCNTQYPTPFKHVNLLAMNTMAEELKVKVGYSDHTEGIAVSIAAVALGATVIEKHFTIDKALPGPDHVASLEPKELENLVSSIRQIELAISGNGKKVPSPSEKDNRKVVRKSIVAAASIEAGEIFSIKNITTKRPNEGVSAIYWDEVIGKKATRKYQIDEPIDKS